MGGPPFPFATSPSPTRMKKSKKVNRSWWRELFIDHPGLVDGDPEAKVASGTGATRVAKVYCILCLAADIAWAIAEDVRAVTEGRINAVRSEGQIEVYRESTHRLELSTKLTIAFF